MHQVGFSLHDCSSSLHMLWAIWKNEQHSSVKQSRSSWIVSKNKGLPRQAEVAQGAPGKLRPRNFLTFGTTRVVRRTHRPPLPQEKSLVLTFRGWVDLRAHGSVGGATEKFPVTPPAIDPGTSRLVAQSLNHYAIPGTLMNSTNKYSYIRRVFITDCVMLKDRNKIFIKLILVSIS